MKVLSVEKTIPAVRSQDHNMSVVKLENYSGPACHGCLCTGRKISPLGSYSALFFTLIGPLQPYTFHGNEDVKVCWECRALLKKVQSFQTQLRTAQQMLLQVLYQGSSDLIPLSKLTTANKDSFDYDLSYSDVDSKEVLVPPLPALPIKEEIDPEPLDYNDEHCTDFDDFKDYDTKIDIPEEKQLKEITKVEKKEKKLKLEKSEERKKSKKEKSISLVAKYRKYARLIRTEKKEWGSSCEKYFTKVYLSEGEIEEHLNQTDRTQRGFSNVPYKCKECLKGYIRAVDYYRHMDLNHHKSDTSYQCRVCKKTESSLDSLAQHWRVHCGLYQCNMCGDYSRPRILRRHLNQQHTKVYGCAQCRLEFGSLTKFAQHFKESHGSYTCDYCNKVCLEKRVLEKHILHRHVDHRCSKCNRQYKNYTKYRDHLRLFHPKEIYKNANLELAYCVECDRQYPSVYKYKIHIKESPKHTPKQPTVIHCPECGKRFSRKCYMNNHYRHAHLKVTNFYCDLCNKYYANGYGLRQHRESVHLKLPKMKDKICDICGRGFHTNGVLIKHRRTHTGERPYQCQHCSAAFAQSTACKTHMRTQHRAPPPPPEKHADIMHHML